MASTLKQIRSGLKDRLELSSGPNLKDVHVQPVDSAALTGYPTAVITLESLDPRVAMGGTPLQADFRVIVLVADMESPVGFENLDEYVDPQGTRSIDAAITASPNLGLSDVTAELVRVENVGLRPSGQYGADFIIRAWRVG